MLELYMLHSVLIHKLFIRSSLVVVKAIWLKYTVSRSPKLENTISIIYKNS